MEKTLDQERRCVMERRPKEIWKAAMPLPEPVRLLHRAFAEVGHKLHVVGGAVRDFMVAQLRGQISSPRTSTSSPPPSPM